MIPSDSSSVWIPRSRCSVSDARIASAMPPMPTCRRRAVGDVLDHRGGDPLVALVGSDARHLDERSRRLAPPGHLRDVDLVEAERARHLRVGLEEERHAADQRRHVLGVGPEAEVAVGVGHARGGDHERAARAVPEQLRHLREVVGHEVDVARPVRRPRRRREEVADVAEVVAAFSALMRALVEGVHLVDAHAIEPPVLGLEHVEQRHRLAVRHRARRCRPGRTWSSTASGAEGCTRANLAHRCGFPTAALRRTAHRSAGCSGWTRAAPGTGWPRPFRRANRGPP